MNMVVCKGRALALVFLVMAIAGTGHPVAADQRHGELKKLFVQLQAAPEYSLAKIVEARIWQLWVHHDNPDVDQRMAVGMAAMTPGNLDRSLAAFDKVIELAPDFAEGWNKRATVHFMMGSYDASVNDIRRTLDLEPRHFGALSGLGLIFDAIGNTAAAVKVWEKALRVHPHMEGIRQRMNELKRELTGAPT